MKPHCQKEQERLNARQIGIIDISHIHYASDINIPYCVSVFFKLFCNPFALDVLFLVDLLHFIQDFANGCVLYCYPQVQTDSAQLLCTIVIIYVHSKEVHQIDQHTFLL